MYNKKENPWPRQHILHLKEICYEDRQCCRCDCSLFVYVHIHTVCSRSQSHENSFSWWWFETGTFSMPSTEGKQMRFFVYRHLHLVQLPLAFRRLQYSRRERDWIEGAGGPKVRTGSKDLRFNSMAISTGTIKKETKSNEWYRAATELVKPFQI